MKHPVAALILAGSLAASAVAFAQSAPPSAPAPAAPVQSSSAAAPVPAGKRMACQTASQALTGQDRRDQMQLCMAQAHLDCLKQAIDKKIVGPERKTFVKTCAN